MYEGNFLSIVAAAAVVIANSIIVMVVVVDSNRFIAFNRLLEPPTWFHDI